MTFSSLLSIRSHPMRVRGLKLTETAELVVQSPLHPMQVRGLKLQSILCGRIQSVLLSCSYDLVIRWSMQRSNYANTWYIVCFHSIAYLSFSVVNITKTIKTGAILSKIYSYVQATKRLRLYVFWRNVPLFQDFYLNL